MPEPKPVTCPYRDPECPCNDGDACHYEPHGDTDPMIPWSTIAVSRGHNPGYIQIAMSARWLAGADWHRFESAVQHLIDEHNPLQLMWRRELTVQPYRDFDTQLDWQTITCRWAMSKQKAPAGQETEIIQARADDVVSLGGHLSG